jgi:hypothetical protein
MTGCASNPEKAAENPVDVQTAASNYLNDYPTHDRVEYVLNCIAQHGGLNYVNQYACGCKIDKLAEKLNFNDFEAAKTISYLKALPGDGGAVFRDPKHNKDLRKQLKDAEEYAEKSCFVK